MKKLYITAPFILSLLSLLGGCDAIGEKSSSVSIVYGITAALSLLLLIGFCTLIKKKEIWFVTLFASVFIVNTGYLTLAISTTLEEALLANRIAYLGSAMLPLTMLMIIKDSCNIKFPKFFTSSLVLVSIVVFLIAASPGYLDIYYKSVSIDTINGMTVLVKEYGSWHIVYLFYLLSYFSFMIATITYAIIKRKIKTSTQAIILASVVFVNIGVWFLEQIVKIDFEILSVSYIFTELFLLSLHLMLQEQERIKEELESENIKIRNISTAPPAVSETENLTTEKVVIESDNQNTDEITENDPTPNNKLEMCAYFEQQLETLTATEKSIYELHIEKKPSKEIMSILNIKENTLKYHNKNIYSKLGVTSRKELREIAEMVSQKTTA
ncbi:MAG: LuxR C-terminal-related transcriptional regulator [Ruminococcus sp.]|nr:LuxR C-terminal-related transcriptional regulator [Ruminococcus sp.]